ncbi:MAG: hypothetical protein methR_P1242 [Methyloprofundus sp.]|nr:MAG: hypothetical protein methR_P1242 [Methyloprofundus sp.]
MNMKNIKKHVKNEVQKIATDGKTVEQNVVAFIKTDFHDTLKDCNQAKTSIKQATHDTLDGISSGLKVAGYTGHKALEQSAHAIAEVGHDFSNESVVLARDHADQAKAKLDDALDKAHGEIDNVEAKTRDAMEQAHTTLHEKTEQEKARLKEIGEAIADYPVKAKTLELSDEAKAALHQAAEKSKTHLTALGNEAQAHSKVLLHHGKAKASEWLGKLADKVKP